MAGYCDGDVRRFTVADAWIVSKRQDAFLVDRHHGRRHCQIAPQYFPFALPFGHQYLAVRLGELHHQRGLFSGRDSRAVG